MSEKQKTQIDVKTAVKLGVILFAISAFTSFLLALTNVVTRDQITLANEAANAVAKQAVFAEAGSFEPIDDMESVIEKMASTNETPIEEIFAAYEGSEVVGYTIKSTPKGYSGPIELVTGITIEGEISGIEIISQTETPGLGAKMTEPAFKDQLRGKSTEEPLGTSKIATSSDNEIQAISGATISSAAVTSGINASIEAYKILEEGSGK